MDSTLRFSQRRSLASTLVACLSLSAMMTSSMARADSYGEEEGAPPVLVSGIVALGGGAMLVTGGLVGLGGGIFLYTNPTTFETDDSRLVLFSLALLGVGGMATGLGLTMVAGGTGILVGHTFFEE